MRSRPAAYAPSMPRAQIMRRVVLALAAATAAAAVAANAVVLHEGGERVRAPGDVPQADVVLVLGAGLHPDGSPSDMLTDRLVTALDLYRAWLEERGVPDDAIVMDHAGFDTYSSIWRARTVFGVRRAVVVTQAFHLPRALFLAGR